MRTRDIDQVRMAISDHTTLSVEAFVVDPESSSWTIVCGKDGRDGHVIVSCRQQQYQVLATRDGDNEFVKTYVAFETDDLLKLKRYFGRSIAWS